MPVGLSSEELSQMTGTTVFTASRLLSQWTELGIIRTERRSVLIENLSDLIDLAEGKDS
jgi:CRP-like cAMP-binding protein